MSDELNHLTDKERELYEVLHEFRHCASVAVNPVGLMKLLDSLNAARAKLAKLPRTADGVEIVPGMVVYLECPDPGWWKVDPGTILETTVKSITAGKGFAEYEGDFTIVGCELEFGNFECYSTRAACEAAIAAKGEVGK